MATQVIGSLSSSSLKVPTASGIRPSIGTCTAKNVSYTAIKYEGKRHMNSRLQNMYRHDHGFFRSHNVVKSIVNSACLSSGFHTNRTQDSVNLIECIFKSLEILFRFSRPYATIATVLSVISTSLLAVESLSDISPLFLVKVFQAIIGGVFMQMYVCGFNQICDIDIDKINKPNLPLASGKLSMKTAIIVTTLSAIISLSMVLISGSWPLFYGLFAWFFIGTAYSANVLPLLRWKRFPYTAVLYMINSRALAVPCGYYLHVQNAIGGGLLVISRRHIFSIAMLLVFSIVLILFKDIPDIKGDEMHGIKSLASQIGPERMFWSCIGLLGMAYVVSIFIGVTASSTCSKYVTVLGHFATGLALLVRAKSADLKNIASISSMYLFLWKLFYVEFLLLPLVR